MKKRILTILSLIVIGGLIIQSNGLGLFNKNTAYAIGDLTVDWGIGVGNVGPIFNVSNFAPGEDESRDVDVSNGAPSSRSVGVRGIESSETGSISGVLDIVISEGGNDLYGGSSPTGPKTLAQFFAESSGPDGIPLSLLGPGSSTIYTFKVTFNQSAGNEFQNTQVIFDLKIGISIPVPPQCSDIEFDLSGGLPIFGTSRSDRINGTSGNDLIFALGGSDKVDGKGGNDCIVGGNGSDKLIGGNGNDVILGGNGSDSIEGNNGADKLYGEAASDSLNGGSGNDELYGGDGSDSLKGENGNDILDGGSGSDSANGGSGTDTCTAESMKQCE